MNHHPAKTTIMTKNILFILLTFFTISTFAQKVMSEGTIVYKVMVTNGKEVPGIADAFDGARLSVFMKGSHVRSDFKSKLRLQSTLYDGKTGMAVILKESGAEKYLIQLSADQWGHYNRKYEGVQFIDAGETKTILGYECRKAEGTMKDGGKIIVYYSPDMVPLTRGYEYSFKELAGLALAYEVTSGKITVKYEAESLQFTPVTSSRFDVPTSGYKMLNYQ